MEMDSIGKSSSLKGPVNNIFTLCIGRAEVYRFGFNGQEKDDEILGAGNTMTAEFWEYNARLGRRWNIDPILKIWESGYATFSNSPIIFIDPNGLDPIYPTPDGKPIENKSSSLVLNNQPDQKKGNLRFGIILQEAIIKTDNVSVVTKEPIVDNSISGQINKPQNGIIGEIKSFFAPFEWLRNQWGIMFTSNGGGQVSNGDGRQPKEGMVITQIPIEAIEAISAGSMRNILGGSRLPEKPNDPEVKGKVLDVFKIGNESEIKENVGQKDGYSVHHQSVNENGKIRLDSISWHTKNGKLIKTQKF